MHLITPKSVNICNKFHLCLNMCVCEREREREGERERERRSTTECRVLVAGIIAFHFRGPEFRFRPYRRKSCLKFS